MTSKSATLALGAPASPACVHGSPELPKSVDSVNLALNRLVIHSSACAGRGRFEDDAYSAA